MYHVTSSYGCYGNYGDKGEIVNVIGQIVSRDLGMLPVQLIIGDREIVEVCSCVGNSLCIAVYMTTELCWPFTFIKFRIYPTDGVLKRIFPPLSRQQT